MSSPIRPQDLHRPAPASLDALDRSAGAAGWAGTAGLAPSWTERADAAHVERLVENLHGTVARDPSGFADAMAAAFGDEADRQTVDALIDAAMAGRLAVPPVRIVEPGALGDGARGAYAASGGPGGGPLVLLDRTLLADEAKLTRVFTEEYGHHLDAALGGPDSAGDEGRRFAAALLGGADGEALPPSAFARMAAENDRGTVLLDGRSTAVEFRGGPAPGSPAGGAQGASGLQDGGDDDGPSGASGGGGSSGAGNTAEDEADEAGRETSPGGGTAGGANQTSEADEAEEVEDDEEEDDEDDDDDDDTSTGGTTGGTTGGSGPGPVTAAPVQTTGGFDPSLGGLIGGGTAGEEREEYVTVDGGGAGGGGPGDDTTEDNVGDGAPVGSGSGGTTGGFDPTLGGTLDAGLSEAEEAEGGRTEYVTLDGGVSGPGAGVVAVSGGANGGDDAEPLGPVYDPPPDNMNGNMDGNPFDEIEALQPLSGPEVQVPMAPPPVEGGEAPSEAAAAVVPATVPLGPLPAPGPLPGAGRWDQVFTWLATRPVLGPVFVAAGAMWPSSTGGPRESSPIAGTAASVESHGSDLDGEVYVDGEPTGVRVDEIRDEDGAGTGAFAVRNEADAEVLEAAGVPVGADGTLGGGAGTAPSTAGAGQGTGATPGAGSAAGAAGNGPRPGTPVAPPPPAPAPEGAWGTPGGPATGGEQMGPVTPRPTSPPDSGSPPNEAGVDQGGYYEPSEFDDEVVPSAGADVAPGPQGGAGAAPEPAEPMGFEAGGPAATGTPPTEAAEQGPTTTSFPAQPPGPTSVPGPAPVAVPTESSPQEVQPSQSGAMVNPADSPPPPDDHILREDRYELRRNLVRGGDLPPGYEPNTNYAGPPGWQAHHIVPLADFGGRFRPLLDRLEGWGIDRNSLDNGVWLPRSEEAVPDTGRTGHNETRRRSYAEYISDRFEDVTTAEEAEFLLDEIKEGLENGTLRFPLQ